MYFSRDPNRNTCKMAAIRKLCGKDIELGTSLPDLAISYRSATPLTTPNHTVFIDGPHLLQPVDLAWSSAPQLGASEASDSDPALAPRAWWKANEERTRALGLDASLALLRDVLKADQYEVCLY